MRIAVLVTVHNRVAVTVNGLSRLADLSKLLAGEFQFRVFLVDDGSTDGTGERVREVPLDLTQIRGTGSLYWNRGMAWAYRAARDSGDRFDAYMLYNDDVVLDNNFIEFMRQFKDDSTNILVGAFREPGSDEISYSGFVRVRRLRPFAFINPELDQRLVPVDTFNGNVVLVPSRAFEALGGLDPKYTHAYGDLDLGLRAKDIGVSSFVFGVPIGSCERGSSLAERVAVADIRTRWKLLFGFPHGPRSYLRFVRKHGITAFFPLYAVGEIARRARQLLPRSSSQDANSGL
ncbi:MAG: glycosyltransferase family 2 protein [Rhodococcus erythropolis]|jgi:GT2 family glycosyltransferase|nr:glycosyltransferase [Rhodococcus erythropolis]MDF2898701.1 glycosyltransferase family 2 protein [Rhodococcus erythropolis]